MTIQLNTSTDKYSKIQESFQLALERSKAINSDLPIRALYQSLDTDLVIARMASDAFNDFNKHLAGKNPISNKDALEELRKTFTSSGSDQEVYFNQFLDNKLNNNTNVQIGPLSFSSSVQSIQIVEHKNLEEIPSVRKSGTMLVPYGSTKPSIVINFLFNGFDSINNSLRPLIALFKICPITCVNDEVLERVFTNKVSTNRISLSIPNESTSKLNIRSEDEKKKYIANEIQKIVNSATDDKSIDKPVYQRIADMLRNSPDLAEQLSFESIDDRAITEDQLNSFVKKNANKSEAILDQSRFIPVALTHISLSTNPEIPEAIFCSLTLNRISVSEYMNGGMRWRTEDNTPSENPKDAYFLKIVLGKYIANMPYIKAFSNDSLKMRTKIYGLSEDEILELDCSNEIYERKVSVASVQAGMANYFSFPTLIGKEYPTAQHVGSSNIYVNTYLNTSSLNFLEDLNAYKRRIDRIFRSEIFEERVYGISLGCQILELLGKEYRQIETEGDINNSFYMTNLSTNSDENNPDLLHVSINFIESKIQPIKEQFVFIKNNTFNVKDLFQFWKLLFELALKCGIKAEELSKSRRITFSQAIEDIGKTSPEDFKLWKAFSIIFGIQNPVLPSNILNGVFSTYLATPDILKNSTVSGIATASLLLHTLTANHELGFDKYITIRQLFTEVFGSIIDPRQGASIIDEIRAGITKAAKQSLIFRGVDSSILFGLPINRDALPSIIDIFDKEVFEQLSTNSNKEIYNNALDTILKFLFFGDKPFNFFKSLSYYLTSSGVRYRDKIIDAMFYILYYNPSKWNILSDVISDADIFEGKNFLIDAYQNDAEFFLRGSRDAKGNLYLPDGIGYTPRKRTITTYDPLLKAYIDDYENTYTDFDLPTYWDLFGPSWIAFAPSWDELGILAPPNNESAFKDSPELTETDLQNLSFANPNDRVPPSIFFYYDQSDLIKQGIKDTLNRFGDRQVEKQYKYYAALDFDINDLAKSSDGTTNYGIRSSLMTLPRIIESRLNSDQERSREKSSQNIKAINQFFTDSRISDQDRQKLIESAFDDKQTPEEFEKALFDKETGWLRTNRVPFTNALGEPDARNVGLYYGVTHGGTFISSLVKANNAMASAILRGSIRRLGKDYAERVFSSIDTSNEAGLRRLTDNTSDMKDYAKFIKDRGLSEVSDNTYNPNRAFPVYRFYLLDEKSKKYVWHDIFTGIGSVSSIEITHDKHDAGLAKIEINDPLRFIQNEYISEGDIDNGDPEITFLNAEDSVKYRELKTSLKLKVGRPILIKMGYSSNVEGLHTVFTGRITEIVPGDTITVLAQSWKAEVQAHEVQFVNAQGINPFDGSLRSFIDKAIKTSEVQGLGHVYSPAEKLSNFANLIQQGQNIYSQASRSLTPVGAEQYILYYGFNTDFTSLDTRLMNIWLPNTRNPTISQIIHPLNPKKNWVFPMQPVWDALQEASRHSFGYICDVVPFETRGTIFFGRPDQPYFSRQISPKDMGRWRSYQKSVIKEAYDLVLDALDNFMNSQYFDYNTVDFTFLNKQYNLIDGPVLLDQSIYAKKPSHYMIAATQEGTFTAFLRSSSYFGAIQGLNSTSFSKTLNESVQNFVNSVVEEGSEFVLQKDRRYLRLRTYKQYPPEIGTAPHQLYSYDATKELDQINDTYADSFFLVFMALIFDLDEEPDKIASEFPYYYDFFREICKPWGNSANNVSADDIESFERKLAVIFGQSNPLDQVILRDVTIGDASRPAEALLPANVRNIIQEAINQKQYYLVNLPPTLYTDAINLDANALTSIVIDQSINNRNGTSPVADFKNYNDLSQLQQDFLVRGTISERLSTSPSSKVFGISKNNLRVIALKENVLSQIKSELQQVKNNLIRNREEKNNRPANFDRRAQIRNKLKFRYAQAGLNEELLNKTFQDLVNDSAVKIKLFIIFFAKFLSDPASIINKDKSRKIMDKFSKTKIAPNMSVFRKYHYVSSDTDLISNDIFATTKQMNNTIIIQHPKTISDENWTVNTENGIIPMFNSTPAYWPEKDTFQEIGLSFSPGLAKSIKKVKMVSEMNVGDATRASVTALSNLAIEMRPMYRGSLTMLGRHIKPWDVIILNDKYSKMRGPVDVERVTHHFSINTGWTTTIIPQLLCHPNPGSMVIDVAQQQAAFDLVANLADTVVDTSLIALALAGPVAGLLGTTARGVIPKILGSAYKATFGLPGILSGTANAIKNFEPDKAKDILASPGFAAGQKRAVNFLHSSGRFISTAASIYMAKHTITAIGYGIHNIMLSQQMISRYSKKHGVQLCPVVFTPLMLYNRPFTAGVETSDAIFNTVGVGEFVNLAKINGALNRVINYGDLSVASNQLQNQ